MTDRQIKNIWRKVRSSIKAKGRYLSYQRRSRVQREEAQLRSERLQEERENGYRLQIATLERERDESRSAANYLINRIQDSKLYFFVPFHK
jgi:hypothetical protein